MIYVDATYVGVLYVTVCSVLSMLGARAGAKRRRAKPVDPAREVSCAGG